MNDEQNPRLFEVLDSSEDTAPPEKNEHTQDKQKPKKNILGFIAAMTVLIGLPAGFYLYEYVKGDESASRPSVRYVSSRTVVTDQPAISRDEVILQTTSLDSLVTDADRSAFSRYPQTPSERRLSKLKSQTDRASHDVRLERAKMLELYGRIDGILRKLENANGQSSANADTISATVTKLSKHVALLAKTSEEIQVTAKTSLTTAFGRGTIAVAPSVPSLDEYVVKGFINDQASVALISRPNSTFILRKGSVVQGYGRVLAFKWRNGFLEIELENGIIGGLR